MTRSPLAIIFFTVLLDLIGFGIVLPLLPAFAAEHSPAEWQIGLLMASYSFAQFLFAPVWGSLSDRIGRRPVLLISLTGSVLAYSLFAVAGSLAMLFAARLAAGAMAANISTAQAYIADVTPPERRARGMGLIGAAFGLGFVLGPALAGLLAHGSAAEAQARVGFAAAALSAADLAFAFFLLKESLPEERRGLQQQGPRRMELLRQALRTPALGAAILIFSLATIAWSSMEPTLVRLLTLQFNFDRPQIGYLFAGFGLYAAILQGGVTGRMAERVGEVRMIAAGALLLCLGMLLLPLAPGLPAVYAALALLGLGQSCLLPSIMAAISRLAAAAVQGGALGVSQSFSSLSRVIGPAMGGWLFGIDRRFSFFAAAAAALAALLIACTKLSLPPRDER